MPINKIHTNLWFPGNAEEATNFYVSIFDNSKIVEVYKNENAVIAVSFELNDKAFVAINGNPADKIAFSPAVSFQIEADGQEEVDYYWSKLTEGADEARQASGWLVDRYGLSWQVTPKQLINAANFSTTDKLKAISEALKEMKKIDVAAIDAVLNDA